MSLVRTAVAVAGALLALSACGSVQNGRDTNMTERPTFNAAVTPPSTPVAARTTSIAASCGGEPWAFGFSPVEPASGNRYLSVQVRNCRARDAAVPPRPVITIRDTDGDRIAVRWDWRTPKTSLMVPAGQEVSLRLHWLSNGRCERGGTSLDVAVGDRTAHLVDCLQLGGLTDVTGEATRGDAEWGLGAVVGEQ